MAAMWRKRTITTNAPMGPKAPRSTVLLRQRPGTAKGIVFVTVEDEHGDANLVVHTDVGAWAERALGRADEAVETMQRALQLDPLSVRINADLGMAMLAAGRYEAAVAQESRTLELKPDSAVSRWIRGMAHEQLEQFDSAEIDMKAAAATWPGRGCPHGRSARRPRERPRGA